MKMKSIKWMAAVLLMGGLLWVGCQNSGTTEQQEEATEEAAETTEATEATEDAETMPADTAAQLAEGDTTNVQTPNNEEQEQ
ncbi:MAG: hypothetical protein D6765_09105 [Bacteroidetes bacterium]|nr:MAG: hypothetical protein D6765_09105 [Bacteroidota bacterium]